MSNALRLKGYRWVVLGVIILASFVAYTLRTNVSIVGESMMTDLGMNEYQLGLVFSAFAAGYAIFQFPGGLIGDKFGPRRTITAIAILWTVLTVLTAFIPGADTWPVIYTVGSAGILVPAFSLARLTALSFPSRSAARSSVGFPASQWGLPNGLTSTGLTLGAAMQRHRWSPCSWRSYGWRNALARLSRLTGLVAALAYWRYSSPMIRPSTRKLRKQELDFIRSDRPPAEA